MGRLHAERLAPVQSASRNGISRSVTAIIPSNCASLKRLRLCRQPARQIGPVASSGPTAWPKSTERCSRGPPVLACRNLGLAGAGRSGSGGRIAGAGAAGRGFGSYDLQGGPRDRSAAASGVGGAVDACYAARRKQSRRFMRGVPERRISDQIAATLARGAWRAVALGGRGRRRVIGGGTVGWRARWRGGAPRHQ